MSIDDQHIQIDLLNEMRKYINWGYDEETDEEFDFPLLKKDIDLSQFEKFPDTETYYNDNWDDDFFRNLKIRALGTYLKLSAHG